MKSLRVKKYVFLYKTQIFDDKISNLREFYFDFINHNFDWVMDCCVYTKVIYIRAPKWNSTSIEVEVELWKLREIHRFMEKFIAQWRRCKVEVKTSQSKVETDLWKWIYLWSWSRVEGNACRGGGRIF
jgi:hypothetical protein